MAGRKPADLDALAKRLRAAGLRRTGPRVAVLDRLTRAAGPVSHAELYEALEQLGFDRATIYRNLIDLTRAGLVSRTDLGDHVWRYELVTTSQPGKRHVHLVCSDCGQVSCLPGVKVQVRWGAGKPPASSQYEVQLKGQCSVCSGA
jgi:Fur family ferric uptake transcriptional regulator